MMIIGFIFDAAILGVVIAAMQEGEFPGWGPMIGCVLVIGGVAGVLGHFLPGFASLLALIPAAAVGALMISWLCGMTFQRAVKAAGIYLGVRFLLSFVLMLIF